VKIEKKEELDAAIDKIEVNIRDSNKAMKKHQAHVDELKDIIKS